MVEHPAVSAVPVVEPEGSEPPRRRRRWVTAGVVGALLASAGVVGVGNLRSANLNGNESAAIATLKNISSAQAQCQACGAIDVNGNECGEYGFLGELAGQVATRAGKRIDPPVLSSAFGNVAASRVERSGYVFQLFLPGRDQMGIAEDATGGDPGNDNGVDAGRAEILWCCYAWPRSYGWSGKRTFFVNQSGDLLATNAAAVAYDGDRSPCSCPAAFAASASVSMSAIMAANTVGHDGNFWVVI